VNERFYKLFHEHNAFQRYLARRFFFNFFQRLGIHVTGNHFYELVPDTGLVAAQYTDAPRELPAIDWRFDQCEQEAIRLLKTYGAEYKAARQRFGFTEANYYYNGLDSLMLFVFLRDLKPAKMIEIGQGFSTRIALSAFEFNVEETGTTCEFISIDPYARYLEGQTPKGAKLRLLRQQAQAVDMKPLLKDCGFLFVDSSHVFKFGSDVEFQFARLYPRLGRGAILHVHDLYSPYHYPLNWIVREKRFWNEQYILENFLAFNRAFEVLLPLNLLARRSEPFMAQARSLQLEPGFNFAGSAFYMQRKT
jgi:hypothetical protein